MTLDHCRSRKINVQSQVKQEVPDFTTLSLPSLTVHPLGLPKWYNYTAYNIGALHEEGIKSGLIMKTSNSFKCPIYTFLHALHTMYCIPIQISC